ncbi:MAG: ATP-dependent sacrificial sulfur transferase LarE [Thermodesulfovibrionia bacterium]
MSQLLEKFDKLKENLKRMDRVIIAYSGGVDSTFLLKTATLSGLKDVIAVTASSESLPDDELLFAIEMAKSLNVKHRIISTEELNNEDFSTNPPDRCYYCKRELFGKLREMASEEGIHYILDGTNLDDASDWRPGMRAGMEFGIISPLRDVGLTKDEIRQLSLSLNLKTWDKPSTPCLASRFPYGQRITSKALERVEDAERFIKGFGIKEIRVREHKEIARIEVPVKDFMLFMDEEIRRGVINHLKSLGYLYITLDLQGLRSGSLNEMLTSLGGELVRQ